MRFASLTAGLLARKGEAHPASTVTYPEDMLVRSRLGWTSPWQGKAEEPAAPVVESTTAPPLPRAKPAIADEPCSQGSACHLGDAPAAAPDPQKRFHVSVRLKRGHYIRLKLASAQLHRPSQDIIAEALTDWYARQDSALFGDCTCLDDGDFPLPR